MSRDREPMLGPGGRIIIPKSESRELERVIDMLTDEREAGFTSDIRDVVSECITILTRLRRQVSQGYHRNPSSSSLYAPFKAFGVIGKDVHSIAYAHAKDGKLYKHDFNKGSAEVVAVERHGKRELLVTSPSGIALWDEF